MTDALSDAIERRPAGRFLALVTVIGAGAASLFMASTALGYVSSGTLASGDGVGAFLLIASFIGLPVSFIGPLVFGQWSLGHRGLAGRGIAAGLAGGVAATVVAFAAIPAFDWLDGLIPERALDSGAFGLPPAVGYVACGVVLATGLLWMVTGRRIRDARVRWALVAVAASVVLLAVSSSYLTGLLDRVYDLYDRSMSDIESTAGTGQYGEPLGGIGPNGLELAISGNPYLIVPYSLGASLGIIVVRKRRVVPA